MVSVDRSLQKEQILYVILYSDHCCLLSLGLEGHGASIYLLEAQLFQQPQKLPHADQVPDSHLNGASLLSGPVQNIRKETLQD